MKSAWWICGWFWRGANIRLQGAWYSLSLLAWPSIFSSPGNEEKLDKLVADHQRKIDNQKQTIQVLEVRLANIKETRALNEPVRSLAPVSPNGKLILSLALVLGLILGVFAAFMAEFLARVRERVQEEARPTERVRTVGQAG